MGGRRISKQGPPQPLDESRINSLKRQRGKVSDEAARGKKRKISDRKKDSSSAQPSSLKNNGKVKDQTLKKPTALPQRSVPKQKSGRKIELLAGSSEDEVSELDDGLEDGMSLGSSMADEFDLDGSSVYDSDVEQNKQTMFSEDEDESDAEEKLTAANIEGLSKKLDEEKDAEAANAQLELEDAAMQTNIQDKLKVLDDDDSEEDGKSRVKTNLHLAPDLQLLRTRITDTIRVLDDFAKLAEDGRSRADYTTQFLKDVCLYYGYSPFLAEKLFNLFSPREAFDFFEANESPRPVVLRTNTLKTHRRELAQALINRGVTLGISITLIPKF